MVSICLNLVSLEEVLDDEAGNLILDGAQVQE